MVQTRWIVSGVCCPQRLLRFAHDGFHTDWMYLTLYYSSTEIFCMPFAEWLALMCCIKHSGFSMGASAKRRGFRAGVGVRMRMPCRSYVFQTVSTTHCILLEFTARTRKRFYITYRGVNLTRRQSRQDRTLDIPADDIGLDRANTSFGAALCIGR